MSVYGSPKQTATTSSKDSKGRYARAGSAGLSIIRDFARRVVLLLAMIKDMLWAIVIAVSAAFASSVLVQVWEAL